MALPLDSRQFNNVVSTTLDAKLPELTDNVFTSNPLFVRLNSRGAIRYEGGDTIRSTFIYDKLGGGSYGKGDLFDTTPKEFLTDLLLQWKMNYVPITFYGIDMAKNQGAARVIDLVGSTLKVAEMTIKDNLGTQLFADGTGNASKDIDGLRVAIDDTLSYGGITRDASKQGTAVKAQVNTVGGAFSLAMFNTEMGLCTFADEQPDLIVTTQTIWNKGWERIQPSERYASEDLKKVGMRGWQLNGADVVVDSHCPSGTAYFLNTKYIQYWILSGFDMKSRLNGGMPIYNQDATTDQLICYGNLVVKGPRMCGRIDSIS